MVYGSSSLQQHSSSFFSSIVITLSMNVLGTRVIIIYFILFSIFRVLVLMIVTCSCSMIFFWLPSLSKSKPTPFWNIKDVMLSTIENHFGNMDHLLKYYCVRRRRTHTNHVVFRNQSRGFYEEVPRDRRDAIRFQGLDAILGGWMDWLCGTDSLDRMW